MVRKKQRYFVVEIIYEDNKVDLNLSREDIFRAIRLSIQDLYGDYGIGAFSLNLFVKYVNPYTKLFFVQAPREYQIEIRACLTFIKMLRNRLCILNCIYVAATIKSAEVFLLKRDKETLRALYKNCKNVSERAKIMEFTKKQNLDVLNDLL
ncbi:uncharacterized protein LOC136081302 [Hydra vulgaris]|uniref:uncharacterized protein LOC136081302 n=1 Tax=Hydra vulgaris TaxID=6087 RepID=UPI0032E9F0A8